MDWLNLLGIAVGLAMDAFAVSVAAGVSLDTITRRHVFRLAFHFGLFQFLMPVVGWLSGRQLASWMAALNCWLAFGLLMLVGGKMLLGSRRRREAAPAADPTRGVMLVSLSVATSLDALAVGLSMALLGVSVWVPAVVIGLVAGGLTAVGIRFGNRIGPRWGRDAEAIGGCVLLVIGLRILAAGLLG